MDWLSHTKTVVLIVACATALVSARTISNAGDRDRSGSDAATVLKVAVLTMPSILGNDVHPHSSHVTVEDIVVLNDYAAYSWKAEPLSGMTILQKLNGVWWHGLDYWDEGPVPRSSPIASLGREATTRPFVWGMQLYGPSATRNPLQICCGTRFA